MVLSLKSHGFIAGLLLAIFVAYLFPQGPQVLPLTLISDLGIGAIFLLYGMKISPKEFRLGIRHHKLHLLVQLTTFLLFPVLVLCLSPFYEGGTSADLWLALFFLAALPSTVSSSVVMVSLAQGNVPAAIFNASLSGLLGIFLTPVWLSFFIGSNVEFHFLEVLQKLFLQILCPLFIGLLLQRSFGLYVRQYSSQLAWFDKSIIALIVYTSFSASFSSGLFHLLRPIDLGILALMVVGLFFVVFVLVGKLAQWLKLEKPEEITARFCGTKKSLVHGSVMVKIIFGSGPRNGLLLLPIMLYHILQLLVVAFYSQQYTRTDSGSEVA